MQKKVIIIGAGPAGLTAAYKLAQAGCDVQVFEAGNHVGGLARSFELWGQIVDCGPHRFFSSDKIVNDFFLEVVKDDFVPVSRLTRIYYRNKFFHYPLKVGNVLTNLSPLEVLQILFSYLKQTIFPFKNPKTFEEWVVNKFGRKLFNIFFKNYTEKLWGIPCANIDADWAAQRIKQFSLMEAMKSAVFGGSKTKHKTLVEEFAYPKHGTGTIYQKMKAKIEEWNGKVNLNQPVEKVLVKNHKAIGVKMKSGEEFFADEIISTMPLTLMVAGLGKAPQNVIEACRKLYYRNTILVYAEVDSKKLFPDNWIYVHMPEVKHGRITNFRNWSKELYGDKQTSILCLEYWCFENDEIWKTDDVDLGKIAAEELVRIKLIAPTDKILNTAVVRLPRCYPVYETGYMQHLSIIKNYLDTFENLRVIGRYGSFKYNNQDHSMLMGLLAAKEIAEGSNQNLWSINSDSEYQEAGKVLTKE
jgi:protoporphyrinogen oxidase